MFILVLWAFSFCLFVYFVYFCFRRLALPWPLASGIIFLFTFIFGICIVWTVFFCSTQIIVYYALVGNLSFLLAAAAALDCFLLYKQIEFEIEIAFINFAKSTMIKVIENERNLMRPEMRK